MKVAPGQAAAGQNERVQRVECRRPAMDLLLEGGYVALLDPVGGGLAVGGDATSLCAMNSFMLQSKEKLLDVRRIRREMSSSNPERRSEFVKSPERLDATRVLSYTAATGETCLAAVAGTGVEPRRIRASGRPCRTSNGDLSP